MTTRDLGDHAAGAHVAEEDVGVAAQADHALLDAGAAGVVDADERAAHLHREVHDLDDLLGEDLAQAAAEDGEVLAEEEDLAAVDRAVAGDDAVAQGRLSSRPKPWARWRANMSSSTKRARVEQQVDALAGGQLAARVLALDGRLGARVGGLLAQPAQAARASPRCSRLASARTRSYSPNSSRITPHTSPTVARARSASRSGGSRLAVPRAAAAHVVQPAPAPPRRRGARAARAAARPGRSRSGVDALEGHRLLVVLAVGVHAHHHPLAGVHRLVVAEGGVGDGVAHVLDALHRPAAPVDLVDQLAGAAPRSRP